LKDPYSYGQMNPRMLSVNLLPGNTREHSLKP